MLTLEKFEQASEIVKRVTNPTKLVYSDYLSQQTGGKVYLKPENMQYTGAYKLRGAYYKISTLSEEERAKGDYSFCREPCTGRRVCGKSIWLQSYNCYADCDTTYQSQSYKELRGRSDFAWGCI